MQQERAKEANYIGYHINGLSSDTYASFDKALTSKLDIGHVHLLGHVLRRLHLLRKRAIFLEISGLHSVME